MIVDSLLEEVLKFLDQRDLPRQGRDLRNNIRNYLSEFSGIHIAINEQEKMLEILESWLAENYSTHCQIAFDKVLQSEDVAKTMYDKYTEFLNSPDSRRNLRLRFFQYFSRAHIQRLS